MPGRLNAKQCKQITIGGDSIGVFETMRPITNLPLIHATSVSSFCLFHCFNPLYSPVSGLLASLLAFFFPLSASKVAYIFNLFPLPPWIPFSPPVRAPLCLKDAQQVPASPVPKKQSNNLKKNPIHPRAAVTDSPTENYHHWSARTLTVFAINPWLFCVSSPRSKRKSLGLLKGFLPHLPTYM